MSGPLTAAQLVERLRTKYPEASHAVLEEVRNGAGFSATRSADVLVMGLWPSRGLYLQGFEIKVSRGDWMRELREPAKADALFAYCDYCWVVANGDIVRDLELPEAWGLIVPKGRGLSVVKPAPRNTDPKPLTRSMLAALLKRAWASRPGERDLRAAKETAAKEALASSQRQREHDRQELQRLTQNVREFEQASGLSIEHGWDLPQLGAAVKRYLSEGLPGEGTIRQYRDRLVTVLAEVERLLSSFGERP